MNDIAYFFKLKLFGAEKMEIFETFWRFFGYFGGKNDFVETCSNSSKILTIFSQKLKNKFSKILAYIGTGQVMGWGNKAIEIRSVETGHLDGVFMHKKAQKLKFLCERNDKVFFSSAKGSSSCQIYFMTLNKPGLQNW